jgi:hypothetical protein
VGEGSLVRGGGEGDEGGAVVSSDVAAVADGAAEPPGSDVGVAVTWGGVNVVGVDVAVAGVAEDGGSAVAVLGGEVGDGVDGGTAVPVTGAVVGVAGSAVSVAPDGVGVRVGMVCRRGS